MSSLITRISLLGSLILTAAACTQAPAQVELKGQNVYGRNGVSAIASNTFNSNAYSQPVAVYTNAALQTTAAVQPIGVSDLSAPSGNVKVASNTKPVSGGVPFQKAQPDMIKPVSVASTSVNPWTNKPHDDAPSQEQSLNIHPQGNTVVASSQPLVSDVKKTPDTAVAKLDSIIDSEGSTVKKTTVAITKPVKLVSAASGSSFMWPVNSKKVISEFGPKGGGKINDGINIASAEGEPVWSAADGEVVYVGNELKGYGNMVLIKHNGDKATTYAHMSRATVEKYDRVKQGDIIGYVGATGSVKDPQLHFAIRDGKDAVDPLKYLDRKVASLH